MVIAQCLFQKMIYSYTKIYENDKLRVLPALALQRRNATEIVMSHIL